MANKQITLATGTGFERYAKKTRSIRLHSTLGYRSPIEFEQSESNDFTKLQKAS
jgi:hypothetical protein